MTLANSGAIPWSKGTLIGQVDDLEHNYFGNKSYSIIVGPCNVDKLITFDLPITAPRDEGEYVLTL